MAPTLRVLHLPTPVPTTDHGLIAAAMREARYRTGLDPDAFALRINLKAKRLGLALNGHVIRAYEQGESIPVADVFLTALEIGELPLLATLREWLQA